jgi:tRNA threonylcarbamoyladenosine modification (KEOPS) complex  Pcc1 subunit
VDDDNDDDDTDDILVVQFYATQCKGLRVSISSFLEYIQVALKCYQEFA